MGIGSGRRSATTKNAARAAAALLFACAVPAYAQETAYDLDMPAGDLGGALRTLAQTAHVQITFDAKAVRGKRTRALKGRHAVRAAIDLLLDGSGLRREETVSGVIVIRPNAIRTTDAATTGPGESAGDIVVTGTLIPTVQAGPPTPVFTLTNKEIAARGYTGVADAIQRSPFATGAIQGASSGYTQGARTARLFGFGPGFTKYLIDGRPMGMFPALYSNSAAFVDLSVIPTQLVERVDILPGGQSSLYGSDAIAGVVNVTLRKKLDGPTADARLTLNEHGGGRSLRFSAADSFGTGPLTLLFGAQYETTQPIWNYQRELGRTPFRDNPDSPPVPDQAISLYASDYSGNLAIAPAQCDAAKSLYGNGIGYFNDPFTGDYCGNSNTGYGTLANRERRIDVFGHASYDLGTTELYADVLYGHSTNEYTYALASTYYDSSVANAPINIAGTDKSFFLIRGLAPEELGGTDNLLSRQTSGSLFASIGIKGSIGQGDWRYDVNYVRNEQTLTMRRRVLLAAPLEAYFRGLLGTPTGTFDDPYYGTVASYAAAPAALFAPIPRSAADSFYANARSTASTSSDWGRVLMTNGHLLTLPGGDAGIAIAVEGGRESWKYTPDAGFTTARFYGFQRDISGDGDRNFLAGVGELRLPVARFATLSGSIRYDRYFVDDIQTGKASYNIAAEVRPLRQVMLRARYGTAFKAPTLADLYQGASTQLAYGTDFARCAAQGISSSDCAINVPYSVLLSGNPALRPITANVADLGIVLNPVARVEISIDYLRWKVRNGVSQESDSNILRQEALCRTGSTQVDSERCATIYGYVRRDERGGLVSIYSPRINISRSEQEALVAGLSASQPLGNLGQLDLSAAYTLMLSRKSQATPTSRVVNLLRNTVFNTDFRSRANASLGWTIDRLTTSLFVERVGTSPNYIASTFGPTETGAARLPSLTTANLGLSYAVTPKVTVQGNVNNLFDAGPPTDNTYPGYTTGAYNAGNYNIIGRSFMVQLSAAF